VLTVESLGCRIGEKLDRALRLLQIDGKIVDQDIRRSGSGDRDIRKSGKREKWSGWSSRGKTEDARREIVVRIKGN
jgi:hypothetical protein